jgi:excisionase family DNA binding protein
MSSNLVPAYLSVRQLADYLGVSLRTAYSLVHDGDVPVVRIRGQHRIPRAELDRALTERTAHTGNHPLEAGDA